MTESALDQILNRTADVSFAEELELYDKARAELAQLREDARLGRLLQWLCKRADRTLPWADVGWWLPNNQAWPTTSNGDPGALEAIRRTAKEEGWEG